MDLSRPVPGDPPGENPLWEILAPTEGVCPGEILEKVNRWLARVRLEADDSAPGCCGDALLLWRGNLWDRFGLRGAVDRGAAIGVKALETARRDLERKLKQTGLAVKTLNIQIEEMDAGIRDLISKADRRRHADETLPVLREREQSLGAVLEQAEKDLAGATKALSVAVEEEKSPPRRSGQKGAAFKAGRGRTGGLRRVRAGGKERLPYPGTVRSPG